MRIGHINSLHICFQMIIIDHIHVRSISYIEYDLCVSNEIIIQKIKVINHGPYKLLFIVNKGTEHSI